MTIRIIAKRQDATAATQTNADVHDVYQTFDIQCPELQTFLAYNPAGGLITSQVIGATILQDVE